MQSSSGMNSTGLPPGFSIAPQLVDQIRHQALTARQGHEVIGRLVLGAGGNAVRYDPLVNYNQTPDNFTVKAGELRAGLQPGESPILVHSHPNPTDDLHPSKVDLQKANAEWLGVPYAIFFKKSNRLGLFRMNTNRKSYSTLGLYR